MCWRAKCSQAKEICEKVTEFDQFTAPMKQMMQCAVDEAKGYVVCSAIPRIIDSKPSKNPRYLQIRPDLVDPMSKYVAEMGMRFFRAIPADKPLLTPVEAVLVGRRNNPEDKAAHIRGLAVYNPIHYQDLPELFMDFICSLTGKSPSTTGAGSEGALTKGPFNALSPTVDGVLRLDTRTGAVSTCNNSGAGWACYAVPDERSAMDAEIGRLQAVFPRNAQEFTARDKELADLNDDQDRLERRLTAQLPEFKRLRELADKGPADLARPFLELFEERSRRPRVDAAWLRALGGRLFDHYFVPVWPTVQARVNGPAPGTGG